MSAKIDIYNQALVDMGEDTLVGPAQDNNSSRALNAVYNIQRLAELRANRWKFSIADFLMPALSNPPQNTVYSYGYQLPADCLMVLDINHLRQSLGSYNYRSGLEKLYEFRGSILMTQISGPITLRYIKDVNVTTQFDVCFVNALAAKIAYTTAYRLTQSSSVEASCKSKYKERIAEAKRLDAIEKLPEGIADDSWVTSRL